MFLLLDGEKITVILLVKAFTDDQTVFMVISRGMVKKILLIDFSNLRKVGIIVVSLDDGDYLIGVELIDGQYDVMFFLNVGKVVCF